MSRPKKVCTEITREEFFALLHRHADEDATQWVPGMQMLLTLDDAAFIEDLRRHGAQPTCSEYRPAGIEKR